MSRAPWGALTVRELERREARALFIASPFAPVESGELFTSYSCTRCSHVEPTWEGFLRHRQGHHRMREAHARERQAA